MTIPAGPAPRPSPLHGISGATPGAPAADATRGAAPPPAKENVTARAEALVIAMLQASTAWKQSVHHGEVPDPQRVEALAALAVRPVWPTDDPDAVSRESIAAPAPRTTPVPAPSPQARRAAAAARLPGWVPDGSELPYRSRNGG